MNTKALLILGFIFIVAPSYAGDGSLHLIDNLSEVSLYLKPRYNLDRTCDQEFGILARVARSGNFLGTATINYDPLYPIRFDRKPRWSAGFQFTYNFIQRPTLIGIYTRPKFDLVNVWKEESGLTARLYGSQRLNVYSNLAYQWNYPYVSDQKPTWFASINFQFPL